jgi:tetratricopeptide (TPR) repeat protein
MCALNRRLPMTVAACLMLAGPAHLRPSGYGGQAGEQDAGARARQAYARAIELETAGNHAGSLSLLWEAAGLAPGDADVQIRLGEALERIGALDAAVDAYRAALAARPDFRKAANNLILALVKAGRGPEAVQRARALAAAAPDDPDRLFTLGLAQSEQQISDAIATFRRVLEIAPRHTLARYNLALVLRRADRLTDAIDELERALAIEPRPEVHYTLGIIYWHQGNLERAARALRAAVAARPDYADAHYTLGAVLKAARDWTGASAALRRAIALRPTDAAAHYTLGQVRQSSGDPAGAREHLAEAERLRLRVQAEQEAGVWTSVGARQLDGGDPESALVSFRRAISAFEGFAPAHYQMGRALQRLNRHDAARAAFSRAQQLNPSLLPPPNPRRQRHGNSS